MVIQICLGIDVYSLIHSENLLGNTRTPVMYESLKKYMICLMTFNDISEIMELGQVAIPLFASISSMQCGIELHAVTGRLNESLPVKYINYRRFTQSQIVVLLWLL